MMVSGESTTPSNMMYLCFVPREMLNTTGAHKAVQDQQRCHHLKGNNVHASQSLSRATACRLWLHAVEAESALVVKTAGCPQLNPHQACA
jgi:hypothetical protein